MAGHKMNDERPRTADVEFDLSLQFSKMFLSEPVLRGLTRNNFTHPSPIQARAIPLAKLGLGMELVATAPEIRAATNIREFETIGKFFWYSYPTVVDQQNSEQ